MYWPTSNQRADFIRYDVCTSVLFYAYLMISKCKFGLYGVASGVLVLDGGRNRISVECGELCWPKKLKDSKNIFKAEYLDCWKAAQ